MRHAMMYLNDVFLVYDIIVFETSIFFRSHENEKTRRFQKSLLWRALFKRCVFGNRFTGYGRTDTDGGPNQWKKMFSNKNGYAWTGP